MFHKLLNLNIINKYKTLQYYLAWILPVIMHRKHWNMLENVRRAQYSLEAMRKAQCICEYSRSWRKLHVLKIGHYNTKGTAYRER